MLTHQSEYLKTPQWGEVNHIFEAFSIKGQFKFHSPNYKGASDSPNGCALLAYTVCVDWMETRR